MIIETINVALQRKSDKSVKVLATFAVRFRHGDGKLLANVALTAVDGKSASGAADLGLSQEDYAMACHVAELRARERLVYLVVGE